MAADLLRARLLLWTTALVSAVATGLLSPPRAGSGLFGGVAIGTVLFVLLAGDRPRVPSRPIARLVARGAYLSVAATYEELAWRGLGLGIGSRWLGPVAALVLTSLAFALCHRAVPGRRRAVHLATGLSFGAAFLSGGLAAAIVAHATYNVLVDLGVQAQQAGDA